MMDHRIARSAAVAVLAFSAAWFPQVAAASLEALGFERIQDWTSEHTTVYLQTEPVSQGDAALAVPIHGYTRVLSGDLSTADSGLPEEPTHLWVDLRIPADHSSWIGSIELIVRVPEAGIWWQPLSAINLSEAPRDQFITYAFELPGNVADALKTAGSYTLYVNLNASQGGSPWLLDNARFSLSEAPEDADDPESGDPVAAIPPPDGQPDGIDLGAAGEFNAFLFDRFTAQSSDVQGRLFAGGQVDLLHYSVGDRLSLDNAGDVLVSGGNVRFPSGRVYHGNILAAGSTAEVGASVRSGMAPGATVGEHAELPFEQDNTRLHLEILSSNLTTLEVNGTVDNLWGGLYLHGDGTSELQVFDLDGTDVLNAHTFSVDGIPDGAHVIINIDGDQSGLTNMSMDSLSAHRNRVLLNFHQATSLNFSGIGIQGSVLAPYAQIHNPQGVIQGTLVADHWNGPMQFNHHPFEPYEGVSFNVASPPVLSFVSPEDNALFNTAQPTLTLAYQDPDGDVLPDSLQLSLNGALLAADCTHLNEQANCIPDGIADGSHEIEAVISDAAGLVSEPVRIQIRIDTTPPLISFDLVEGSPPQSNATPTLRLTFGDEFSGVDLETLSLVNQSDGQILRCNASSDSDRASCIPETPLAGGENHFAATIDDRAGNRSLEATIRLTIDDAPPQIVVSSPTNNSQFFTEENRLVGTVSEPSDLTINGQVVNVSNDLEFEFPTLLNFGLNNFDLIATDAAGNSSQLSHRLIRNRSAPSITSHPPSFAEVGSEYLYSVQANDPDPADTLVYSLGASVEGLALDPVTGILTWQPTASQLGDHEVIVSVTDQNGDVDRQFFVINVFERNLPPTAESQSLVTAQNTPTDLILAGNDPDGDEIIFVFQSGPAHGSLSGTVPNLTYTPDPEFFGEDTFVFLSNDGDRDSEPAVVRIVVSRPNLSPNIVSDPRTEAFPGELYLYPTVAVDPDPDDKLMYSLVSPVDGLEIEPTTGLVSLNTEQFLQQNPTAVSFPISVVVADLAGATDAQSFEVNIRQADDCTPPDANEIFYDDFADLSELQLNGVAKGVTPASGAPFLRLTESLRQAGAAFISQPISLEEFGDFSASFSSSIVYRIGNPIGIGDRDGRGADGIAFLIHTNSESVGGTGGGIGYAGVRNSVAVEFDTYENRAIREGLNNA